MFRAVTPQDSGNVIVTRALFINWFITWDKPGATPFVTFTDLSPSAVTKSKLSESDYKYPLRQNVSPLQIQRIKVLVTIDEFLFQTIHFLLVVRMLR
jgi:hypothetical protein